ncbi:fibronectin type III domain-containing protein [Aquipuribacter sp. MA13-6]|uniref:fibronectin type III domain-containing protein n=1 Tax=unclassified Aquipuribacter TaxID=2635084 RepID=UPI003EECBD19
MRTIAALAAVVVVGASGIPSALAGTVDPEAVAAAPEVTEAADATEDVDPGPVPVIEEPEEPVEAPTETDPAVDPEVAVVEEPDVAAEPSLDTPATSPDAPVPTETGGVDAADEAGGGGSEPDGSVTAQEDVEAAAGPLNLLATASADGDVVVTWTIDHWATLNYPCRDTYQMWLYIGGLPGNEEPLYIEGPTETEGPPSFNVELPRGTTTHPFEDMPAGEYMVNLSTNCYPGEQTTVTIEGEEHVAPQPPTDLDVVVDDRAAVITWSAPSDPGTSSVTGYLVFVDDGAPQEVQAPTSSASFPDLAPGLHSVRVQAVSDHGISGAVSDAFSVTAAPTSPVAVTATQDGEDGVSVSWSVPEHAGHPGLDGYSVWLDDDEAAAVPVTVGDLSTTLTGVAPGLHTVSVRAISEYGDSAPASTQVYVGASPSVPLQVTSERLGSSRVTIRWAAPSNLGHPQLDSYDVTLDGGTPQRVTQREVTLTGVALGAHTVTVVANNEFGHSAAARYDFDLPALPSEPIEVEAEQTGPTSVLVFWTAPSTEGDSPIIGYRVTASPRPLFGRLDGVLAADAPDVLTQDVGASVRSHEFTGLRPGTEYTFSVAAITEDGVGEPGSDDEQTNEWRAPSVPTNVSVTQTGDGQVTVRFGAPEDSGTSEIVGYVLGLSGPDFGGYEEFDADTREIVIDDLPPGEYAFRLLAVNEQGADGAPFDIDLVVQGEPAPPADEPVPDDDPLVVNAPVRTVVTAPAATYTTAAPAALARTGAEAGTVALGGVLLLLMGVGAMLAGRRRQVADA